MKNHSCFHIHIYVIITSNTIYVSFCYKNPQYFLLAPYDHILLYLNLIDEENHGIYPSDYLFLYHVVTGTGTWV